MQQTNYQHKDLCTFIVSTRESPAKKKSITKFYLGIDYGDSIGAPPRSVFIYYNNKRYQGGEKQI